MMPNDVYAFVIFLCVIVSSMAKDLVIVTDFNPAAIYYAELGPRIVFKKINVDGGKRNITFPADVDYDPVEQRVYWTQWASQWTGDGIIARCDLQGRFYKPLVRDLEYPVGLALDSVGRRMYFSHEAMALESAKLDGTGRRTVIRELTTSGWHVFFDAIGKRVFWGDSIKQVIESSRLDGRNRTVHVSGLEHPSDVFVDRKAGRLFWADYGSDRISTSNLKGEDERTLYQFPLVSTETLPYSIAVTPNLIYMIDRDHPKLQKIPKNIREDQTIVPRDVGNVEFGWPSGLHIHQAGGSVNLRSASVLVYIVVPVLLKLLSEL